MKILFPLSIVGLLLLATPGFSAAPAFQVEVKCEPKRADVKRSASTSTEEAAESWVYLVTVTSHTFQDIPDVRVEYVVSPRTNASVQSPKRSQNASPEARPSGPWHAMVKRALKPNR